MKHLLKKLADKLKLEKPNTKTLQAAGILDENNNFTKPYINLNNNDSHNNITTQ